MQYVEWITKPIFISIHGLFDYVGNGGLLQSIEEVGLYPLGAGASRNGREAAFSASSYNMTKITTKKLEENYSKKWNNFRLCRIRSPSIRCQPTGKYKKRGEND